MSGQNSDEPEFTADFVRRYLAGKGASASYADQAGMCLIAKPPLSLEAIRICEAGLALNQNDAQLWYNKGMALRLLERNEEAITACDHALRLQPNNINAFNVKATALGALRRFSEALACYDAALKINPHDETILSNKARLLTRMGQGTKAPRVEPTASGSRRPEQPQEKAMQYWVVRRTARDTDERGWYKRMEIVAGPFATDEEAEADADRRRAEHQRFIRDENVDKEIRKKLILDFVVWWVMSDDVIAEGRSRGIDIR